MTKTTLEANRLTELSAREYFRDAITQAMLNQKVEAGEETVYYLVNLLAHFIQTERLFSSTPEGIQLEPLALLYAEALEAARPQERAQLLRRLGDVALLIAGLFSSSLKRKLVDVDYYIAMGGSAYGFLGHLNRGSVRGRVLGAVFDELSRKFQRFTDVLAEVGEASPLSSSTDILRLYEIWLRTGSKRTADRLRKLGIEPVPASFGRRVN
ncbi:hypothetical protein [Candidatus Methylocalor cossyra]|uniref:Uncharacterized protein n=1 Tax=Candidatus Methylocalor cossyra TaxID=3108543 RepID=A0ABM9NJD5_9GAMM